MKKWNVSDIPDMSEKIVVVTGSNSGLGFETSKLLAKNNGRVIMTGRNKQKLEDAKTAIESEYSDAQIETRALDLADLSSVEKFSEAMRHYLDHIDILINNAGVMAPPHGETKDGFELQFGTNHLGHFALTAQLFPLLKNNPGSRIVTVSSIAARNGKIHFDDLMFEKKYHRFKTYRQSKLANLMFALELNSRLKNKNIDVMSLAAHPGVSRTNLFYSVKPYPLIKVLGKMIMPIITQPASKGMLPIVKVATSDDVQSGDYYGPDKLHEWRGSPKPAFIPASAKDAETRKKLWVLSEKLTGVEFNVAS
ncbi:MAG: oxidoreductase [Bacteroidota bacterium]|nr:oxidoreductase [Bacteroidota bacterium]